MAKNGAESKKDDKEKGGYPVIIGMAGGTASGKSSVCAQIMEELGDRGTGRVITISQDSFYRNLSEEENRKANKGDFNFDHPNSFENSLLLSVLESLTKGEAHKVPKYDFVTNSRLEDEFDTIEPHDVIIVEGILVFYDERLRNMFHMKVFVDADSDIRLARRVERDTAERGRNLLQVLGQYQNLVKPSFEEFVLPTKKYADLVIPRGVENKVAINALVQVISDCLRCPNSTREFIKLSLGKTTIQGYPKMMMSSEEEDEGDAPAKKMSRPH
ncbi:hypothetical protein L596_013591 [Steinernema carpocapsae]|uniref:Uridine kinase n=1 Tax=Steinernema carpocapsae TaxID=34508 RepID=A0A4V6A546_STECR|nr:hypothetical protein L596_013591 [Steinernema carpocapsae]